MGPSISAGNPGCFLPPVQSRLPFPPKFTAITDLAQGRGRASCCRVIVNLQLVAHMWQRDNGWERIVVTFKHSAHIIKSDRGAPPYEGLPTAPVYYEFVPAVCRRGMRISQNDVTSPHDIKGAHIFGVTYDSPFGLVRVCSVPQH
jgi:hypothetical protein